MYQGKNEVKAFLPCRSTRFFFKDLAINQSVLKIKMSMPVGIIVRMEEPLKH